MEEGLARVLGGLVFRVQALGFRVSGLGCRVCYRPQGYKIGGPNEKDHGNAKDTGFA